MELYSEIVIIALLLGILTITPALSTVTDRAVIDSTGRISDILAVTAESGYWQHIQAAIDEVHGQGDGEVHIPAGTWDFVHSGEIWTGNGGQPRVSVPAGVSIFGAPNNRDSNGQNTEWRTVLKLPSSVAGGWEYGGISWFKISGSGAGSPFTRFSDLKLVGYRSIDSNDPYVQTGVYLSNIGEFRVDHCYFEHTCLSGVKVTGVDSHGVIDHCRFVNPVGTVGSTMNDCSVFYGVSLARGSGDLWDSNVQNVLGKYTSYTVFIEDCYFSRWRHCTASNSGAHYVLRHSIIENDFGYGSVDAHGWGEVDASGVITQVGTRAVEIYNCQITSATKYGWSTYIRGGAGVAFDNSVGGGTYTAFIYLSNEADSAISKCWSKDWYIWGNSLNNGCKLLVGNNADIREGYEYFLYQPSWYTPYKYPHPLTATP
ncbi:MAG: hypothetical protein ACFFDI_14845 [Promethearchaeota archaeon]